VVTAENDAEPAHPDLHRNRERIPRSLLRGMRAKIKIRLKVITVEDSLQLAAGFFNP
jgi:hypothetical protein